MLLKGVLQRQGCWDEVPATLNHCLELGPEFGIHNSTHRVAWNNGRSLDK